MSAGYNVKNRISPSYRLKPSLNLPIAFRIFCTRETGVEDKESTTMIKVSGEVQLRFLSKPNERDNARWLASKSLSMTFV